MCEDALTATCPQCASADLAEAGPLSEPWLRCISCGAQFDESDAYPAGHIPAVQLLERKPAGRELGRPNEKRAA